MNCKLVRVVAGDIASHPDLLNLISSSLKMPFQPPTKIYCFGQTNKEILLSIGADAKHEIQLLSQEPMIGEHLFETKLFSTHHAMFKDGYDSILYTDWDCIPVKPLDELFFKILNRNKHFVKANLTLYRSGDCICSWRKDHKKAIINAGFMYITDKEYVRMAYAAYKSVKCVYHWNDEIAWTYALDEMSGKEVNPEEYWEKYEPMAVRVTRKPYYGERFRQNVCPVYMMHYTASSRSKNRNISKIYLG